MKRGHKEEGGSWMDTYGDMVTLLLCFFVLLYAISAVDQSKWENLVRSLNPEAVVVNEEKEVEIGFEGEEEDATPEIEFSEDPFEDMMVKMKDEIAKQNLSDVIDIKEGEGFAFITFNSTICFAPNSYVLQDEIKMVLDSFCTIMSENAGVIQQIEILGHTAEASPGQEINVMNDRFLSSNRAAAVLVYIQQKNIFDPVKLISIGYGQYRPIADNNTVEGRAKNRRVEILITKNDSVLKSLDEYYKEIYSDSTEENAN